MPAQNQSAYTKRGFVIESLEMDRQFKPIIDYAHVMEMNLNITSDDEHVLVIEHSIQTVKERIRSVHNTLSFKRLPVRLLVELVISCTFG